jgi:hypothetical protein
MVELVSAGWTSHGADQTRPSQLRHDLLEERRRDMGSGRDLMGLERFAVGNGKHQYRTGRVIGLAANPHF